MELLRNRKLYASIAAVVLATVVSFTLVNTVESFTLVNPSPPKANRFVYAVKFICNAPDETTAPQIGLVPGIYATDINVHNPSFQKTNASIIKKFVLATPEPLTAGPAAGTPYVQATPNPYILISVKLGPDAAMRIDCAELETLFSSPQGTVPLYLKGFVILYSSLKLDVVAEYTAATRLGGISIDTQYIQSSTFVP